MTILQKEVRADVFNEDSQIFIITFCQRDFAAIFRHIQEIP